MRCWHKDLLDVLPRQQLISQWRECCCIAKSISEKGTPNHILVNRIMDYPLYHFTVYSKMVYDEMLNRGYKCDFNKFTEYILPAVRKTTYSWDSVNEELLFCNWHNEIYLRECLYNLEEKAITGGISYEEWKPIYEKYKDKYDLWGKIDLWKERD